MIMGKKTFAKIIFDFIVKFDLSMSYDRGVTAPYTTMYMQELHLSYNDIHMEKPNLLHIQYEGRIKE